MFLFLKVKFICINFLLIYLDWAFKFDFQTYP